MYAKIENDAKISPNQHLKMNTCVSQLTPTYNYNGSVAHA